MEMKQTISEYLVRVLQRDFGITVGMQDIAVAHRPEYREWECTVNNAELGVAATYFPSDNSGQFFVTMLRTTKAGQIAPNKWYRP